MTPFHPYTHYLPLNLLRWLEALTDHEFSPDLWRVNPDLDLDAREVRDEALVLDLTGNLDSPCA